MKRLTILFIVLCLPIVMAEEQEHVVTHAPIYRGAEPHFTELSATTRTGIGSTSTIPNFEQWLESYPQSMLPWKPEELKDVKIYLPLGEGESIDDKIYRFNIHWDNNAPTPLHIINDRAHFERQPDFGERNSPLHSRAFRYRPIELEKNNVVRFRFEFQPVKFRPLDHSGAPDPADFIAHNEHLRNQIAPVPEFLAPLVINTAQMRVLVNGRSDGFSIHFSNDGERWYSINNRPYVRGQMTMPRNLLPFETLYMRIATNNDVPIGSFSLDFEALLETHGFRGTGMTSFGQTSGRGNSGGSVRFPLAFYDGDDNLVLFIDNDRDQPYHTGMGHYNFSGSGYSYRFGNTFSGAGGGFRSAHRMSVGPTVPANSTGVYIHPTDKDIPGSHGYLLDRFNFRYESERAPMSPNPPPEIIRIFAGSQRGELTPRSDSPYVRFED